MKGWKAIGFKSYKDYLESDWWKEKKEMFFSVKGKKCEKCGTTKFLQVHHKHYNTLGNESSKDLMVLCIKCHKRMHNA